MQKKKERKREKATAMKKVYLGQLTRTGHSQTQILELKRTTTLSKQPLLYKPKGTLYHLFPEDNLKLQKHALKKNK